MENEEKKKPIGKVKHHVATSPFSYFEFETETDAKTAVAQGRWFAAQFKSEEK